MESAAVQIALAEIFPELAQQFPDSDFRDENDVLSRCGAFFEASRFVRDRLDRLSPEDLARIGRFITECMTTPESDLDNAAATCFLENLAYEPAADAIAPYLSGNAAEYFRQFFPD
ncbi:MAG TPA: hypothetical protein VFS20_08570 [Longimicrobium sp.]|nr:hypothetical protein [Longimicrobium sp.]